MNKPTLNTFDKMTSRKIKGIKLKERLGVAPRQGGEGRPGQVKCTIHDPRCGLFVTENITEVFSCRRYRVSGGRVCRDSRYFSVSLKLFQNKK